MRINHVALYCLDLEGMKEFFIRYFKGAPNNMYHNPKTGLKTYILSFEDDGIGIPSAEAEHIFEEFVQLDEYYDGTGIGLTVARSMARRLGGDITLDTSYSNGARFIMTLPLDGKEEQSDQ